MLYYITLTQVCGLKCRYCQNTPDASIQPLRINYSLDSLVNFISQDREPIICFYGGDPLMEIGLMEKIMELFPDAKFVIQTNGLWLRELRPELIHRFETILVSIDGRRGVTDYYRGEGVYDRVLDNLRYVRDIGYDGDLVARMAVSGKTDIYLDVMHLLTLEYPYFDHVHWQLDALWDYPPAQRYSDFRGWLYNNYLPGLRRLVDTWVDFIRKGMVLGIAPFKGITYRMLTGYKKGLLPCGSGIDAFAIGTDGRILACPIAPEYSFNIIGDIRRDSPDTLRYKIGIGEPCRSCSYYDICGGRCLFANKTMLWGEEGFELVCESVKYLIDIIRENLPVINSSIRDDVISIDMLRYPPFLNSVEVIP